MTNRKILIQLSNLILSLIYFALFVLNLFVMNYWISAFNLASSFIYLILYQIQIEIDTLEQ